MHERFCPRRPSGQPAVTGVPPCLPRYLPSFSWLIEGFSVPTFYFFVLVGFHRISLTHALALSARHFFTRGSPYEHGHALGETRTHDLDLWWGYNSPTTSSGTPTSLYRWRALSVSEAPHMRNSIPHPISSIEKTMAPTQ